MVCGDGLIGMERLLAAAQNGGVAGLETEAGGVRRDVGARFVNDDDHADGRGNLLQAQAVGAGAVVEHAAHRVGQGGHFAQTLGHGRDAFVVQLEAVEHGVGKAALRRRLPCRSALASWMARRLCSSASAMASRQAFFSAARQPGQLARGVLGLPGQPRHLFAQTHGGTVIQIGPLKSANLAENLALHPAAAPSPSAAELCTILIWLFGDWWWCRLDWRFALGRRCSFGCARSGTPATRTIPIRRRK